MCEQCLTWPISFGNPLPGYKLMRARRDGNDWKRGEWGLIQCNDPTFTWKKTPTPSPTWGMTDEEEEAALEAMGDDHPDRYRALGLGLGDFEKAFNCSPTQGYELIAAAKKRGYNPKKHGFFTYWFFDYLGEWLKTAKIKDEGDQFPTREEFAPVDLTIGKDPLPNEDEGVEE